MVEELAEQRWLPTRHAPAVEAMLSRQGIERARLSCFVAGRDCFAVRPSSQGSVADQWATLGWSLDVANDDRTSGAAEVLMRLGDVQAGIEPTLQIFRTCTRLIECLPALQHDPHHPECVQYWDVDADGMGGDDAYDALRYGLLACPGAARGNDVAARLESWRG